MEWYKFENTSEIPRGGSAVFVLDMYIHPATMSTYRLEFFSPINSTQNGGKASICDARVMCKYYIYLFIDCKIWLG